MKNVFACSLFACLLVLAGCGEDSSSSVSPEPAGDSSSSVTSASSENIPSSSSIAESSSELGGWGSSSSSSAKSSSSTESKSAVSSSSSSTGSSSVLTPCEEEGNIIQRMDLVTKKKDWYICQDGFYVLLVLSSSSAEPSSSYFNMDSLYNSETSYGEYTDPRDGQTYRTIVEKPGWVMLPEFEVFAQNLNYGVQIKLDATEFDDRKVEKYCYEDDPWYCDNGFGGLYSWSEAFGLPKACDSVWTGTTPACPDSIFPGWTYDHEWDDLIIQGACPDGWHVMNRTEWMALMGMDVSETGAQLISAVNRRSNGTGFSALLGGAVGAVSATLEFVNISEFGYYHLAFENAADTHKSVTVGSSMDIDSKYINYKYNYYKNEGLSVRCVKDY